ncbi:hypothetical protein [Ureaplasma ceti]|uniref:Uncharacterized protein n=1 Tax=Ureaplasma ceti TaxID=3119530 RepID=A0ABP9UAD9_9BACT
MGACLLSATLFLLSFKIDMKYLCHVQNYDNAQFLIVDKPAAQFLLNNTQVAKLENNGLTYLFKSKFIKELQDKYVFATNLNLNLTEKDLTYLIVTHQPLWAVLNHL